MDVSTVSRNKILLEGEILILINGYPGTSVPGFKLEKLRRASMVGPPPNVIVVIMQSYLTIDNKSIVFISFLYLLKKISKNLFFINARTNCFLLETLTDFHKNEVLSGLHVNLNVVLELYEFSIESLFKLKKMKKLTNFDLKFYSYYYLRVLRKTTLPSFLEYCLLNFMFFLANI
ncbi:hypothetical protein BpHYR1_039396 [Brachionus plicatilis]|uniref:Uncharacterized protein n=1 Tax=Brachionus plicatilis TaxID=10195 RepID=A0A3M7SUZ5_BRAPC|nr:hypothetical protein BpHYR1_039396 [Brachionus plicatilis]